MYGRWFNVAIIFLWIVTMSWLVKEKVLPPLLTGPPPDRLSVLEADQKIGWLIRWNQCPIGWATSQTEQTDDGKVRMLTTVHFDHLPLSGILPKWLIDLPAWAGVDDSLKKSLREATDPCSIDSSLETDATSELLMSSTGQLEQIKSSITLVSLGQTVDLVGKVDGDEVELSVKAEDLTFNTKISLSPEILMSNALTPQTHLPNLYAGRTWMVGVVSPFRYPIGSIEVMFAKVVGREPYHYNGKQITAWVVEYHEQPNVDYAGKSGSRCRIWVHPNGTVLRQEVRFFKACISFERKLVEEVAELCCGDK